MSKWKALVLGIVSAISSISWLYYYHAFWPTVAFGCLAIIMLCSSMDKIIRDAHIVSQARLEKLETPKVSATPMTSKGSRRLFVPPPISD